MTRRSFLIVAAILFLVIVSLVMLGVKSLPKLDPSGAQSEQVHYSEKVAVLMYHHLEEEPTPGLVSLAVREFEEQMRLLKENGFSVIDMEQYARYILEGATVPDNAVLLTFDDGYESFYTHGYPILREYNYPATNFVIVSSIDDRNRKGIPKLTWEQMRGMKKDGMSFYSHTYDSHLYGPIDVDGNEGAVLSNQLYLENQGRMETITEYVRRISDDLALAERRLQEELSNKRGIVAFPYGQYNQEELSRVLQTLGIEFTFTVQPGINSRSDRLGHRIDASSADQTPEKLIAQLKALKDVPYN